jgi:hypothetical protein
MEIKNNEYKNILVLSRDEFIELFSKGYPKLDNSFLNDEFTHICPGDNIYNHFVYNQFYEVCKYRGFIFEERDREKVISILKNGTTIDFDDYLLTY